MHEFVSRDEPFALAMSLFVLIKSDNPGVRLLDPYTNC
jgi:hypothetical protein